MDPLSITGGLIGLFSLGIQLVEWGTAYVNSVRGRQQDVASARHQLRCMGEILNLIRTTIEMLKVHEKDAADGRGIGEVIGGEEESAIRACVNACCFEIEALQALLKDLTQGDNLTQNKLKGMLSEQKKRLSYMYKRENLFRLEGRVGSVNARLQTTLATINL
jgi:hypothetical protein